jgi:hypothetical protein
MSTQPLLSTPLPGSSPEAGPTAPTQSFTRVIRRIHLYLGLFLAPWMLMYALSTSVMNHREFFQSLYPSKVPAMVMERELDYTRVFASDETPAQIGSLILQDIGLEGSHRVSGGQNGKPLVIDRQHAWVPRRVTWNSSTGKLIIEKPDFRTASFLERMHRRRGYQQPYALEDAWAFSVDAAMITTLFWCLSGIWLWRELKPTRLYGTLCGTAGVVAFILFLALL